MIGIIKLLPSPIKVIVWRCIYLFSSFLFFLSVKHIKNKQDILKLRNIYNGQRCFVVGNGPSLKTEDLEVLYLHNEISFAANKIANIFVQTNWRPTYYAVFDESHQRNLVSIMSETQCVKKFFDKNSYLWTKKVKGTVLYLNGIHGKRLLKHPRFSDDISQCIYDIATVTFDSLQIAVYMGIKEIYLIGCDHVYPRMQNKDGKIAENKSLQSHFIGADDKKAKHIIASQWEMDVAYEAARKYADAHGIKIMNATRGGQLEVFPRINFDSLF